MIANIGPVDLIPMLGFPDFLIGMQFVPIAFMAMPPLVLDLLGLFAGGL